MIDQNKTEAVGVSDKIKTEVDGIKQLWQQLPATERLGLMAKVLEDTLSTPDYIVSGGVSMQTRFLDRMFRNHGAEETAPMGGFEGNVEADVRPSLDKVLIVDSPENGGHYRRFKGERG